LAHWRATAWKELLFQDPVNPGKAIDACEHRLNISPEMYKMWRMGAFAIRPLEYNATITELEMEWYWQPKQEHSAYDSVPLTMLPL